MPLHDSRIVLYILFVSMYRKLKKNPQKHSMYILKILFHKIFT